MKEFALLAAVCSTVLGVPQQSYNTGHGFSSIGLHASFANPTPANVNPSHGFSSVIKYGSIGSHASAAYSPPANVNPTPGPPNQQQQQPQQLRQQQQQQQRQQQIPSLRGPPRKQYNQRPPIGRRPYNTGQQTQAGQRGYGLPLVNGYGSAARASAAYSHLAKLNPRYGLPLVNGYGSAARASAAYSHLAKLNPTPDPPTCDNDAAVPFGMDQCLTFSAEDDKRTWIDALDACEIQGGRLATLRHPIDFGKYLAANFFTKLFWSGASDSKMEGSWVWTDGEQIDGSGKPLFPWDLNEPSLDTNKNCMVVHDQKYSADFCTVKHRYICGFLRPLRRCDSNLFCKNFVNIKDLCCPPYQKGHLNGFRFCRKEIGVAGHFTCPVPVPPFNVTIT